MPTADTGPCKGYFPMWWYNVLTSQCEEFVYGGCQGNDNKYPTKEECQKTCATVSMHNYACFAPPDQGPCRASIPRYYFDNSTGTCKEFTYGGCEGNPNNFDTVEECMASCNPSTPYEAKCLARPETGPCMAHTFLWAYNATLGECKTFIYGGCDGTENKYPTKHMCEATCKHPPAASVNPVCYLPKDPGPCLAYVPRYYYNNETKHCERFIYGGCQGNANNFATVAECSRTCPLKDPVCYLPNDSGPCFAYFSRYYYNTATNTCETFVYGGCLGNKNNFKTLHQCESKCGNGSLTEELIKAELATKYVVKDPVCLLPKVKGPCRGYFPRYYYNSTTNMCEEFVYGGCQGNANNFPTQQQCESKCANLSLTDELIRSKLITKLVLLDPVCELPKKVGPCKAHVPRYYYNTTTDTCEKFVYGGCEGNANNFKTRKACETRCGGNVTTDDQSWKKHLTKPLALEDVIRANPILSRKVAHPQFFVTTAGQQREYELGCAPLLATHVYWAHAVGLNPVCNETKYPGPCFGYFPRYYFNNVTKTCEQFIYGGCRGNGNNFHTLEECQNTCWASLDQHSLKIVSAFEIPVWPFKPSEVCTYPADAGTCNAYMPRFFYNTLTKTCEQFVYGGCGGNQNNFHTYDACEKKCKTVFGVVPRA
ncbi:hypothetical protein HPB50_019823 [Hyalomma asiaticum]|uniref:Uncharacterized protein n=1 Tax=Hyalomma asiaticum TaxID=266040 RepID=A0ACB7RUH2_HYAAI|nr:hypothetical protein HPB50_019823 [Hyalomma asiaticum]